MKGATYRGAQAVSVGRISIHAPVKGATVSKFLFPLNCLNFNPRSREGSDFTDKTSLSKLQISIHAPVKGATNCQGLSGYAVSISIHAPVKGATRPPHKVRLAH